MSDPIIRLPDIDKLKEVPIEDLRKYYFKYDIYKGSLESINYILELKNKLENNEKIN